VSIANNKWILIKEGKPWSFVHQYTFSIIASLLTAAKFDGNLQRLLVEVEDVVTIFNCQLHENSAPTFLIVLIFHITINRRVLYLKRTILRHACEFHTKISMKCIFIIWSSESYKIEISEGILLNIRIYMRFEMVNILNLGLCDELTSQKTIFV
jgi:hypothetical protein